MFQRTSFFWQLSALSPVWMAKSNGRPVAGAAGAMVLILRDIESATWVVKISCGR